MTPQEVAEAERRFEEQLWGHGGPAPIPTPGLTRGGVTATGGTGTGSVGAGGSAGADGEQAPKAGPGPVTVLPLYAMLPSHAQVRFKEA